MKALQKLPDAEFDIMKVLWEMAPPISAGMVFNQLEEEKNWKVQTVITLMNRLVDRGFLKTEKVGRERLYFPLVTEEEYLTFETGNFMKQYHNSSFINLANTLYEDNGLKEEDIDELLLWLKERRK